MGEQLHSHQLGLDFLEDFEKASLYDRYEKDIIICCKMNCRLDSEIIYLDIGNTLKD